MNVHWEVSLYDWNEAFQDLFLIEWQIFFQNLIACNLVLFFNKTSELQGSCLFVLVFNVNSSSPV